MTYGTHLRRSRHGTLYFRYVIPPDVRASVGQSEVSVSLGTASKREAEVACLELQLAAKRIVAAAREETASGEDCPNDADYRDNLSSHQSVALCHSSELRG